MPSAFGLTVKSLRKVQNNHLKGKLYLPPHKVDHSNERTPNGWSGNELINMLHWDINTHRVPLSLLLFHPIALPLQQFNIHHDKPPATDLKWPPLDTHHLPSSSSGLLTVLVLTVSVRQVRVRFDLQWPLGAGEPPPERLLSSAAEWPDEHLCESDEGGVDVRSWHCQTLLFKAEIVQTRKSQFIGNMPAETFWCMGILGGASNNFHVLYHI